MANGLTLLTINASRMESEQIDESFADDVSKYIISKANFLDCFKC